MTKPSPVTGVPEEVLERFESAWQGGKPPALEEYVASVPPGGEAAAHRRPLLRELIKIDLEYRWRRRSSARTPGALNLDGYLSRYPELRQAGPIFAELIGEEYRCRHRWGDRPAHAEYATRFHGHWPELRERLVRIDKELAAELVHEGKRAGFSPPQQTRGAAAAEKGPLMNQVITTPSFLEALLRYQLVDPALAGKAVLADIERRGLEPRALARELLQRGWLTPYQVNQIFLGRAADLWLAPYVLLERLGEGGMGQVFKARHVDMQRLVALKILRKEMLVDAEAVSRFGREVRLLSKLTDPHVVQAHDACLSGTPPYLVMEYVEGMSLGQLVKARGPLPVTQACDYIRQAALGLQHVHEQGMAHRDLKPANLIVSGAPAAAVGTGSTPWGTVKVMDLGLARLLSFARPGAGDAPTASGPVTMGTLDYMAPEQALDFRQADIRSDIYSLGCTLYFLLTSQPPFAEGSPAQKLLMHQMKDPAPLAQFRRDLPPALPALLVRMMAKQPGNRMQTPIEVARLLGPFCPTSTTSAGALVPVAPRRDALVPVATRLPAPVAVIVLEASPKARNVDRLRAWLSRRPPLQRRCIILGAGVCAALLLVMLAWFLAGAIWGKAEEVFLVDLPETSLPHGARLGKGNLHFGRPITVRGSISPKALFLPPPERGSAQVRYQLTKRFRQFKAIVTLDDSFPECPTPITFAVIGDGKVLWQSTPVKKQGDEQEVTAKVSGIDVLDLTVSCPGYPGAEDSGQSTRSIWNNPRLIK